MRSRFTAAATALTLVAAAAAATAVCSGAARGDGSWRITDLGTLGTPETYGYQSWAYQINERGEIIGSSEGHGGEPWRAIVWRQGELVDLGSLGSKDKDYDVSSANAINDQGQIVGDSYTIAEGEEHAVLWQDGRISDLGTLPRGDRSEAAVINNHGDVAGRSTTGTGQHVFLWRQGAMTDLGAPARPPGPRLAVDAVVAAINEDGLVVGSGETESFPGHVVRTRGFAAQSGRLVALGPRGRQSEAVDVNDGGEIVGSISDRRGLKKTAIWKDGKAVMLGVPAGWAQSWAVAVNNHGQVAAIAANKADTRRRAFLWQEGSWADLGTLGGASSGSFAINERGQVVGASGVPGGKEHAFLWENGHMSDLGTLSGNDARAVDINDQGVIVGSATLDPHYSDPTHAVVWTSS